MNLSLKLCKLIHIWCKGIQKEFLIFRKKYYVTFTLKTLKKCDFLLDNIIWGGVYYKEERRGNTKKRNNFLKAVNKHSKGGKMRNKTFSFFLLIFCVLGFTCNLFSCKKVPPPKEKSKHEKLVDYAYDYVYYAVEWINRDGWDASDGSTQMWARVSYNHWTANSPDTFNARIDSSRVEDQTFWSQYISFKPGGRYNESNNPYWTGTYCQGLVYRAAIYADYSINEVCLNNVNSWLNEGRVVAWDSVRIGDLILMDLDTAWYRLGYEHIGIIRSTDMIDSTQEPILSAMGLYGYPFYYAAGYNEHTIAKYNEMLQYEPPDQPTWGYKVYKVTYLRLTE